MMDMGLSIHDGLDRATTFVAKKPLLTLVLIIAAAMAGQLLLSLLLGDITMSRLARRLWRGIVHGTIIGLAGIGLSMTYSILNFANVGHGDYITVGAFVGFGTSFVVAGGGSYDFFSLLLVDGGVERVTGRDLDLALSTTPIAVTVGLIAAIVLTILIVLVIDRLVYRPMRDANPITLLIASIGVAFALRQLVIFVYGPGSRGTVIGVDRWTMPLGVRTDIHEITLLVLAATMMVGLHIFLTTTKLGTAMRAMADNKDLALVTGISTERVIAWTWIIGGGLTGAAGYLYAMWVGSMSFNIGWFLLLLIFAAVILGGIGSIYGAIAGGLVIGLVFELSPFWIPTDFQRAAAFLVMIIVLLYRPQGIFGGKTTA